jgi:hypothetical protein
MPFRIRAVPISTNLTTRPTQEELQTQPLQAIG